MQTPNVLVLTSTSLLAALALTGCASDPMQDRQVDDDSYVDQSGEGYDETARVVGATGEASGASEVKVYEIDDGAIYEVGSAAMREDGERYSIDVDAEAGATLVFEAHDDSGARIGSAVVVEVGAEGETTWVAPMTTETDVEAQVFLDLQVDRSDADAEADQTASSVAATVRLMIDATVAASAERASDEADARADLAASIAVAVEAEAKRWAERGESFELDGTVDLFSELDAELFGDHESGDASLDIDLSALLAARASDREDAGMDAEDRASLDSAISLGVSATLHARDAGEDMEDAADRIGAMIEASATVDVLTEFFAEHDDMDDDVERSVLDAAASLKAEVFASASGEEAGEAWSHFELSILGELAADGSDGEGEGVIEALFDLEIIADLSARLDVIADLRAELEASLTAEAERMEDDAEGFAGFVVDAQAALEADIASSFEGMGSTMSDAEADLAVTLVTEANARFVRE